MVNFNKLYNSFTNIGKNNNQKKINEYFKSSNKTTKTRPTIQSSDFYTEQVDAIPTDIYQELSRASGRGRKTDEATSIGLHNSLCSILVKEKLSHKAVGMVRLVGDGGTFCTVVGLCVLPIHRIVDNLEKHNNINESNNSKSNEKNNNGNKENGTTSINSGDRRAIAPTPALATSSLAVIAATATGINKLSSRSNTQTTGVISGRNSGTPPRSLAMAVTTDNDKYSSNYTSSSNTKETTENDGYVLERLLLLELREYINEHIPKSCYVAIIASNRSRRIYEEFGFVHQDMVNQFGMFLKK